MVKPSRHTVAPLAAAALAVPAVLLSGCSPHQPEADGPGPAPSIWTGSAAPETPDEQAAQSDIVTTELRGPDGAQIATAQFDFTEDFVKITVRTTGEGQLTPGFHGLHLHEVGKCEPDSVAPAGGEPGDFLSAGGHFRAPDHHGHPASGDLTSLQIRQNGEGLLVTTTDAFTREDLEAGAGTSIIIHAGDDNFANIPADRYVQIDGTPGPDETTLKTGDAGQRAACGVISSGS
ncbi:superoxide dismutase family protein [Mycolicibacillus trivialis]|uniref:Superoxide dismutase [Cu-Zn] n=1 Tax=Mycolicibacillus trivialis TaxID=1798 RepID=A0A1X2EMU3_9MYCO|nr:superoxide dismutase family protein [Mycolicibacillus trivialis]ORX06969.1 superoxide dismutase [Mycolicibacillus trivialis]